VDQGLPIWLCWVGCIAAKQPQPTLVWASNGAMQAHACFQLKPSNTRHVIKHHCNVSSSLTSRILF
jgi:hypothetical protein